VDNKQQNHIKMGNTYTEEQIRKAIMWGIDKQPK